MYPTGGSMEGGGMNFQDKKCNKTTHKHDERERITPKISKRVVCSQRVHIKKLPLRIYSYLSYVREILKLVWTVCINYKVDIFLPCRCFNELK